MSVAEELDLPDYHDPAAAEYAELGFALIGWGRRFTQKAEVIESSAQEAERKRATYDREEARLKKQRQRSNKRLLAQTPEAAKAATLTA